jgi:hypothetical protein
MSLTKEEAHVILFNVVHHWDKITRSDIEKLCETVDELMEDPKPMNPHLRRTLAELIAGLQVPRSVPVCLGAGVEPYDELRRMFKCFGWQTAKEVERNILNWEQEEH